MDFGALRTDLVQTMTLELTDYMTQEQSYQKLKVLGGEKCSYHSVLS